MKILAMSLFQPALKRADPSDKVIGILPDSREKGFVITVPVERD